MEEDNGALRGDRRKRRSTTTVGEAMRSAEKRGLGNGVERSNNEK